MRFIFHMVRLHKPTDYIRNPLNMDNASAPLDYAAWLKGLRGASLPLPDPGGAVSDTRALAADETLDYVVRAERAEYVINNIALLNQEGGDGTRVYHDVELPRTCDVAADLKSLDPRVSLSVRIGNSEYEPSNSFLLVASRYSCVHVRMSFSLVDVWDGLEKAGFSYGALFFLNCPHRTKLATGSVFAGPVLYKDGVPRPLACATEDANRKNLVTRP